MKPPNKACGACGEKHWGKCSDRGAKAAAVPTTIERAIEPAGHDKPRSQTDRGNGDAAKAASHRDHMREHMRLKRAKERIPKLEAELKRLRELVKDQTK